MLANHSKSLMFSRVYWYNRFFCFFNCLSLGLNGVNNLDYSISVNDIIMSTDMFLIFSYIQMLR